jgi:hypothetical protein
MEIKIKKMPDKKTLEEFIKGMFGGDCKVVFNLRTNSFEWLDKGKRNRS